MLFYDLRYALRQLRKSPGFSFTVILTLALSVGVATAVFGVINTVILRPLPYGHPDRVVAVQSISHSGYSQPASWPSYRDERAQVRSFEALAAYFNSAASLETAPGKVVSVKVTNSSDNLFNALGVQPLLGRTYLPGEEQMGRNDVVVLSYEVWQSQFGGRKDVVGSTVHLDGRTSAVIGVMPAGFRFPLSLVNAIYTPLHVTGANLGRGNHWLSRVGRLKDGVTAGQAQADFVRVLAAIGKDNAGTDGGRTGQVISYADRANSRTKGPLWTLLGAVLAVLSIGCVNIAGLLLARGVKREREMAMRVAIGAGRQRLLRQMLTEGLLLALVGAAGGVLLAWMMLNGMRAFLIHALSRGADIHIDWAILGAATAIAVLASLAASLYPALRLSGVDPNRSLKAGGNTGTQRSQHRLRSGFVITQVALTLVLLVVAGLLIRVVTQYRSTDLGFDPKQILSAPINLSPAHYQGRDMIADFYQPLLSRVAQIPGVRAAGVISVLPIESNGWNSEIHIAGQPPYPSDQVRLSELRFVSTGYFDVFGIPLHRGRALSTGLDSSNGTGVATVVVNEAFVKEFIPAGLEPTAQRMDDAPKQEDWTKIVGVTGSVRQDIYEPPMAEQDYLMDELPAKDRPARLANMSLVLRVDGDPYRVSSALRSALHDVDPTVPFPLLSTMTDVVSETLVFERMVGWLFGIFAGLALLLALVGLYGLISHEVELSSRDIGVRMALGATRPHILSMILKRVTWMLAAGTAAGLVLTVVARKIIGMVIYFDAQKEAGGFLSVAILLMVAGIVAALIPASRAASIEPMQALRTE
jgi:putative ABC transport system permease protein